MTSFVARRNTEVGFTCFTWSVHNTAHDCNLQRNLFVCECGLCTIGDINDINLCSPTTWACNQVNIFALTQTERLKQLPACSRFFHWISSEAVPDRVANAFHQQCRNSGRRFNQSAWQRSRFGDAKVQRMIRYFAQLAISLDHERNIGSLDRDFDQIKIDFFKICDLS